ncbi:PREDICTED: bromodomain adjacent to zinc finger domain protein 2B-like [Priapulus caudatus]|uniref:Bromodomain adjacent to zinc finger domain protein 2B-like n=1 Tax=Priapulus caudatus TaxID=37621 RepID=A0ABM1EV53_PRICU|nr:PREDICTED: bromodomain adjacent to zinc finger domain protein 2B-like [Priapulus caudatus]
MSPLCSVFFTRVFSRAGGGSLFGTSPASLAALPPYAHLPGAYSMLSHPLAGLPLPTSPNDYTAISSLNYSQTTGGAGWWMSASEHVRRMAALNDYFAAGLSVGFLPTFGTGVPDGVRPSGFDALLQQSLLASPSSQDLRLGKNNCTPSSSASASLSTLSSSPLSLVSSAAPTVSSPSHSTPRPSSRSRSRTPSSTPSSASTSSIPPSAKHAVTTTTTAFIVRSPVASTSAASSSAPHTSSFFLPPAPSPGRPDKLPSATATKSNTPKSSSASEGKQKTAESSSDSEVADSEGADVSSGSSVSSDSASDSTDNDDMSLQQVKAQLKARQKELLAQERKLKQEQRKSMEKKLLTHEHKHPDELSPSPSQPPSFVSVPPISACSLLTQAACAVSNETAIDLSMKSSREPETPAIHSTEKLKKLYAGANAVSLLKPPAVIAKPKYDPQTMTPEEHQARQEELKELLEAQLKQQQQQLKLARKMAAQREKELSSHPHPHPQQQQQQQLSLLKPRARGGRSTKTSQDGVGRGRGRGRITSSSRAIAAARKQQQMAAQRMLQQQQRVWQLSQTSEESADDSMSHVSVLSSSETAGTTTKRHHEDSSDSAAAAATKRRRVIRDERELRTPLERGWRRQTKIRALSMCGVRGDVLYFAPCGKKMRTYPEVQRYLEKHRIADISRDNFSFSTKMNIGEFLDPQADGQGFLVLTEEEIRARIDEFRARKMKKKTIGNGVGARGGGHRKMNWKGGAIGQKQGARGKMMRKAEAMRQSKHMAQQRLLEAAQEAKRMREEEKKRQKEHVRLQRQQEKFYRAEQLRLEKEYRAQQLIEARKRRQENIQRERLQDAMRKAQYLQEREMKRQQAVLLKHQERERRRQHMMLVRALEARKKQEEKERLKEERRVEKRHVREQKIEQRRLEIMRAREMKKPVEDMQLKEPKVLPNLDRIPGVKLAGEAFANCLMVIEFLHNFGDTLELDDEKLPSLNTLQLGLINDEEHISELLDTVCMLLRIALRDPGIPLLPEARTIFGSSILDVTLDQDNVSELLRLYLWCKNSKTDGFVSLLKDQPFTACCPTDKSEILALLCNDLLMNKNVLSQIDENLEQMNTLKRDKWVQEGEIRKMKGLQARTQALASMDWKPQCLDQQAATASSSSQPNTPRKEAAAVKPDHDEEPADSKPKDAATADSEETRDEDGNHDDDGHLGDKEEEEEDDDKDDDSGNESDASDGCIAADDPEEDNDNDKDDEDETNDASTKCAQVVSEKEQQGDDDSSRQAAEASAGNEEEKSKPEEAYAEPVLEAADPVKMQKKVDRLCKQHRQMKNKLTAVCHSLRATSFGQDRYRRRYWVLPCAGGVFVEGLESGDSREEPQVATGKEEGGSGKQEDEEEEEASVAVKTEEDDDEASNLFLQNPCECGRFSDFMPDGAAARDTEAGSLSAGGAGPASPGGSYVGVPVSFRTAQPLSAEQLLRNLSEQSFQHPWFSVLPRFPCDERSITRPQPSPARLPVPKYRGGGSCRTLRMPAGCVYNGALPPRPPSCTEGATGTATAPASPAHQMQVHSTRDHANPKPIPIEMQRGWWRITDPNQLKSLVKSLHVRGVRERHLLKQLQKHIDYTCQSCSKGRKDVTDLEITERDREISQSVTRAPDVDARGSCDAARSHDIEMEILTQVERLEERLIKASMQIKGFKLLPKATDDPTLQLVPRKLGEEAESVTVQCKEEVKEESTTEVDSPMETDSVKEEEDAEKTESKQEEPSSARTTEDEEEEEGNDDDEEGGEDTEEESGMEEEVGEENKRNVHAFQVAVQRLQMFEAAIERRYLLPPLGSRCVDTGNKTPPLASQSVEEVEVSPGLAVWRQALAVTTNPAQLYMCLKLLDQCIAWDKSIMKVFCQICRRGDNEAELLLCDSCDKGFHTYCFRPKMVDIPDGDWFCYECVSKRTGVPMCLVCGKAFGKMARCQGCPRAYHLDCLSPAMDRMPRGRWNCPDCTEKKLARKGRKNKEMRDREKDMVDDTLDDTTSTISECSFSAPPSEGTSSVKSARISNGSHDFTFCKALLVDMEKHECAWPFTAAVDTRQFPQYKKVIRQPMDFQMMRNKLQNNVYKAVEEFAEDAKLIFRNCEVFNEDDSEVGQAGHRMRNYFDMRWGALVDDS